jgi:hypothetical protein
MSMANRNHLRIVAGVLLACGLLRNASAQPLEAGASLVLGVPQSQFRRNVDGVGGGLAGYLTYAPEEQPLSIGLQVTFINYGSQDTKDIIYGPAVPIRGKVTTANNILSIHLLGRMQPNSGSFRPYIEGLIGWNDLFTRTAVTDEGTGESIQSNTDLNDNAFSYGGGGGMLIRLSGPEAEKPDDLANGWFLSFGARYMFGGKAKYLKEGSIRRENNTLIFSTLESTTDLFIFSVGASYHF